MRNRSANKFPVSTFFRDDTKEKGEFENRKFFIIIIHVHEHCLPARLPMQFGIYLIIMFTHTLKNT